MLHPFIYRGKRYNSKKELLRSLEKEFEYIDISITVYGKKYKSLQEVARAFNIGVERLRKALKRNSDIDFLIDQMKTNKPLGIYSVDFLGNEFPSASELCRYWKIKKANYFHRIYKGYDFESCIMGIRPRQKLYFIHSHKEFFTQKQFDFYIDKYAKEVK